MSKFASATAAIVLLIAAGPAFAQTTAPDPVEAKFATIDADKSGTLEGKETESFKADLVKIDTNKDGKVSRQEFDVAMLTGLIK